MACDGFRSSLHRLQICPFSPRFTLHHHVLFLELKCAYKWLRFDGFQQFVYSRLLSILRETHIKRALSLQSNLVHLLWLCFSSRVRIYLLVLFALTFQPSLLLVCRQQFSFASRSKVLSNCALLFGVNFHLVNFALFRRHIFLTNTSQVWGLY